MCYCLVVTQKYPSQWDSLVTTAGAVPDFLAPATTAAFANLALPVSATAGDFRDLFDNAVEGVGIGELQARLVTASTAGVEPNLQHNEGALGAAAATDVTEADLDTFTNFSILPTFGTTACSVNGTAMATTKLDGTSPIAAADGQRQNAINDALASDQCNLVLALGFGHDAAHSTNNSSVAVSTAPTYVSKNINPAKNYARYVALFHVGADTISPVDNNIVAGELFAKPRLLAVVDTEGKAIDQSIAASNP